ncbi:hypothetical protein D1872_354020 [compost metagenome]
MNGYGIKPFGDHVLVQSIMVVEVGAYGHGGVRDFVLYRDVIGMIREHGHHFPGLRV